MMTPIDEGSVVTEEMIRAYAEHFEIDLEDGTQRDGVLGTLRLLEKGQGWLPAKLFDRELTRGVFATLRTAYFTALGREEPGYSAV